jgi:hypothetical protein
MTTAGAVGLYDAADVLRLRHHFCRRVGVMSTWLLRSAIAGCDRVRRERCARLVERQSKRVEERSMRA